MKTTTTCSPGCGRMTRPLRQPRPLTPCRPPSRATGRHRRAGRDGLGHGRRPRPLHHSWRHREPGEAGRAIVFTKPLHDLEAGKVRLGGEGGAARTWSSWPSMPSTSSLCAWISTPVPPTTTSWSPFRASPPSRRPGSKTPSGLGNVSSRGSSPAALGPTPRLIRRPSGAGAPTATRPGGTTSPSSPSTSTITARSTYGRPTLRSRCWSGRWNWISREASRQPSCASRGSSTRAARRGRGQEARNAKYRTIQYMDKLRRALSSARLHAAEPGTLEAVDRLVDHAIEHVLDRYQAEGHILVRVGRTCDVAHDDRMVRKANRLIDELRECQRRHQTLQRRLLSARGEFRGRWPRNWPPRPTPRRGIDLERQLLRPLLELPLVLADLVGERRFVLGGSRRPALGRRRPAAGLPLHPARHPRRLGRRGHRRHKPDRDGAPVAVPGPGLGCRRRPPRRRVHADQALSRAGPGRRPRSA